MKKSGDFAVIPDFPEYFAGKDGRIYSDFGNKIRQLTEIRYPYSRYLTVFISKNNNRFGIHCHKLVASAFYKINPERFLIKHKNKDRCNNKPANLVLVPLTKISDKSELDCFYKNQIREFEIIFLNNINYNYEHSEYKKLYEIKQKNNIRLLYNYLKLLVNPFYSS
jgi:hypothetical protein